MGAEALRILEQALSLSETERAELAAKLVANLDEGSDRDAEDVWAAEITKRAESVVRGEASSSPGKTSTQKPPRSSHGDVTPSPRGSCGRVISKPFAGIAREARRQRVGFR
jgi:hypothetical protein